jgi:type 1 glutamine amidotransferase
MPGGGRMFYTAFGHDVSAFQEQPVMDMIIAGIEWAAHRLD